MKRHALAYAERRGLRVLPLHPHGKLPITGHGSLDATTDLAVIAGWWERWPDANVGIATGGGLLVVDLDGPEGIATWEQLERDHGGNATLSTRTGSGGRHLLYETAKAVPNSAKRLGAGVDTRGEGGYIVAPPSVHPNGTVYEWENRLPIAPVPAWVVEKLRPPQRVEPPRVQPYQGATAYGVAALTRMRDELLQAANGARNDTLNRVAWQAGRLCAGGQIAEADCAQIVGAAYSIGLGRTEVDATFASGFRSGLAADPIAPRKTPDYAPRMRAPRMRPPRAA